MADTIKYSSSCPEHGRRYYKLFMIFFHQKQYSKDKYEQIFVRPQQRLPPQPQKETTPFFLAHTYDIFFIHLKYNKKLIFTTRAHVLPILDHKLPIYGQVGGA